MKVKNILSECLSKMGIEDFLPSEERTAQQSALIKALLAALNIAYREIVTMYLPLIAEERVSLVAGECRVSELEKRILYPIRLTANGENLNYKVYHDAIVCPYSGSGTLTYAYLPDAEFGENDSIDDIRLTQGIMSDGTLAQYYFANKVFDLARSHDADFRYAVGMLRYKGKTMRVRERRWRN